MAVGWRPSLSNATVNGCKEDMVPPRYQVVGVGSEMQRVVQNYSSLSVE